MEALKSVIIKMSRIWVLPICVAVLVVNALATEGTAPALIKLDKGGFLIGDRFYYIDNTANRNREQALAFCESKGGELAKLTGRSLYNVIQASATTTGGYWIDGIDKTTHERFAASHECTNQDLDFSGIPEHRLDFKQFTCLTFYKGHNASTTKIEAISCAAILRGVVCGVPLNGCEDEMAPPPPPVVPAGTHSHEVIKEIPVATQSKDAVTTVATP